MKLSPVRNQSRFLLETSFVVSCILAAFASGYFVSQYPDALQLDFRLFQLNSSVVILAAISLTLVIFRFPQVGLFLLIAVVYSNISEVGVRSFSFPSLLQFLIPLLLLVTAIRHLFIEEEPLAWDPLIILLVGYGIWIFISSMWATDPALADKALFEFLRGLLLMVVVLNLIATDLEFKTVAWVLVGTGIFLGSISVYQVWSSSYGFEFWGFGRVETAHIAGGIRQPRISGPLSDPNYYAQILVVLFPIALYRLWDEKSGWLRMFAAVSLTVTLLAVFFTYSRAAVLALLLISFLIAIHKRISPRYLGAILLISIPLALFVPEQFENRLATLKQLIPGTDEQVIHLDSSFEQRKLYMKAAWSMFNKRTITGVGAGNYSEHFQQQAQEVGAVVSSYEDFGKRRYPHSLYLEIAAETGLVGLVLFGSIMLGTLLNFYFSVSRLRRRGNILYSSLVASIGLGFVGYLTTSIFLHSHYIRYLWLLVGVGMAANQISQRAKEER